MWFVPGPVPVTQKTLQATAGEMISHRSGPFRELYADCQGRLKRTFRTDGAVFCITGSGTLANEAAAANLTPDTKTLCLVNGEFGERLSQACKIYNAETGIFSVEDGLALTLDRCQNAIESFRPDWVFMVQNETATGVTNDVREIASFVKKTGGKMMVDAVSSLGGLPLDCKAWGVDVCTSASQKSLCAPPGLSFVAITDEAMAHIEGKAKIPTYGLNLKTYKKFHARNETPYTPSLPAFYGLRQALVELEETGLENRWKAHTLAAQKVRKTVTDCGFRLFAEKGYPSDTITAFLTDRVEPIKKSMAELGVQIAGGQGKWKGKMLRIAHIGPEECRTIDACNAALVQSVKNPIAAVGASA